MPFSARTGFFSEASAPPGAGYPDFPTQASVSEFNTEVALYSGAAGTIVDGPTSPGSSAYRGTCRGANGNIYFLPRSQSNILEYDPSANTNTSISVTGTGSNNYTGGCLGRNGNIYLAPFSASTVLEFDPVNRTSRTMSVSISGDARYNGAVMDKSGNVICIPQKETEFIEVDCTVEPATVSTKSFGVPTSELGGNKYISGTVHPNGNIYLAPLQSDSFLEIDPVNDAYTKYDAGQGTDNLLCQGAVTGADGKIYGIPYNHDKVLRLDPATGTVDEPFTHGQGTNAYIGGTPAPNGNIYLAPFDADNVFEIDPLAGTSSTISLSSEDSYVGATSDEANVYFCPNNQSSVRIMPTNATGGTNANAYTLSSYVNSGH